MKRILFFTVMALAGGLPEYIPLACAADAETKQPSLKEQVAVTIMMKLAFQLRRIQDYCKSDISRLCDGLPDFKQPGCILNHRSEVSEPCEKVLLQEFGEPPTKEVMVYQGFTIPAGSIIRRSDRDGSIASVETKESVSYQGVTVQPGFVPFTEDRIGPIRLSGKQFVEGVRYSPPSVTFFKDGHVASGMLADDTAIGPAVYRGGFNIQYYGFRKVQSGVLAMDARIQGKFYEANDVITYNTDGSVEDSHPIPKEFIDHPPAEFFEKMQKALLQDAPGR